MTVFEGRTFYIINREGRLIRRPKCTSILENLTFNVTAFLNCFVLLVLRKIILVEVLFSLQKENAKQTRDLFSCSSNLPS